MKILAPQAAALIGLAEITAEVLMPRKLEAKRLEKRPL